MEGKKGTLAFRRIIDVVLTWQICKVADGVGIIGAADAAGLLDAAEAARGTGLVKRSYWVLICVIDANQIKL